MFHGSLIVAGRIGEHKIIKKWVAAEGSACRPQTRRPSREGVDDTARSSLRVALPSSSLHLHRPHESILLENHYITYHFIFGDPAFMRSVPFGGNGISAAIKTLHGCFESFTILQAEFRPGAKFTET